MKLIVVKEFDIDQENSNDSISYYQNKSEESIKIGEIIDSETIYDGDDNEEREMVKELLTNLIKDGYIMNLAKYREQRINKILI